MFEWPAQWRLYVSELLGTAALLIGGLSAVIFMFGSGSPIPVILPDEGVRRAVTGFLFGSTGALVALSPATPGARAAYFVSKIVNNLWIIFVLLPVVLAVLFAFLYSSLK